MKRHMLWRRAKLFGPQPGHLASARHAQAMVLFAELSAEGLLAEVVAGSLVGQASARSPTASAQESNQAHWDRSTVWASCLHKSNGSSRMSASPRQSDPR